VVVHVQNQILAHDGQTNQCNISLRFHFSYWLRKPEESRYKSLPFAPAIFWRLPAWICQRWRTTHSGSMPGGGRLPCGTLALLA
jgi:hypothetical protein